MRRNTTYTMDPLSVCQLVHISVLKELKLKYISLKMAWKQNETSEEVN